MERDGICRFFSPASSISFAGTGAGLNTATSWPRSASTRAMGTRRVGKPRSFAGSMVNRNLAIQNPRLLVYFCSCQRSPSNHKRLTGIETSMPLSQGGRSLLRFGMVAAKYTAIRKSGHVRQITDAARPSVGLSPAFRESARVMDLPSSAEGLQRFDRHAHGRAIRPGRTPHQQDSHQIGARS